MLTGRFNRDFFQKPWPDWKVDVDVDSLTTFFSHTNPGETIVGHPVRITLEPRAWCGWRPTVSAGWAPRSPRC